MTGRKCRNIFWKKHENMTDISLLGAYTESYAD